MSANHVRIDRFTCNRCRERVELETGLQPEGWERVMIGSPPLALPQDGQHIDLLLCEDCAPQLLKFVANETYRLLDTTMSFSINIGDLDPEEIGERVEAYVERIRRAKVARPGKFEYLDGDGYIRLKYADCGACQSIASGETVKQFHDHGTAHDEPDCFHFGVGVPIEPACGDDGPTKYQLTTAADVVTCQQCRGYAGSTGNPWEVLHRLAEGRDMTSADFLNAVMNYRPPVVLELPDDILPPPDAPLPEPPDEDDEPPEPEGYDF